MFLENKQKFAVSVVMTTSCCCFTDHGTLKKYIKPFAKSEALLSYLGCKMRATYPRIKLSGLEMARKHRSM